uniref:Uncharacterized protein n=1 Tax=Pseudo-nitzschia australis TaxID=44445 RepID=A0A6U9Y6B9_9STRA
MGERTYYERHMNSSKGVAFLALFVFAFASTYTPTPIFVFVSATTTPTVNNDCNKRRSNININTKNHNQQHRVKYERHPFWKRKQISIDEQHRRRRGRGPISITDDNKGSSSLGRARRRADGSRSIRNVDTVSSAMMDTENYVQQHQHQQQHQQQQQQQQEDRMISNNPRKFPSQSDDIGGSGRSVVGAQTQHRHQRISSTRREPSSRKWVFPIDFRRQKGRLSLGFSFGKDGDNLTKRRRQNRPFHRRSTKANNSTDSIVPTLPAGDHNSTITSAVMASSRNAKNRIRNVFSSTASTTALVRKLDHELEQVVSDSAATTIAHRHPGTPRARRTDHSNNKNNIEVSLSVDPFSLGSLIRCLVASGANVASVYIGTLKLLGPMLLAKQCLSTVGYIFYDHYNGRYLRTTLNKRVRYLQEYEIIAAARAASRSLLQILCMGLTGRFLGFLLERTNCFPYPLWLCHWWYGVVWLASVCAIGWACEEWGFDYLATKTNNKFIPSFVSVQPITDTDADADPRNDLLMPDTFIHTNWRGRRKRRRNMVRQPWRFLKEFIRDPEKWLKSLLRVVPGRKDRNHSIYSSSSIGNGTTRKVVDSSTFDTLLFPSTWRPLYVMTFLAFSKAIYHSFCTAASPLSSYGGSIATAEASTAAVECLKNNRNLILRSFVVQKTLYSEWHRVFVQERRIALGACVSAIGLLALLWSIYEVAIVDRTAAIALVPIVMARLVSGWINFLLYYNRWNFTDDDNTAFVWRHDGVRRDGGAWYDTAFVR